MRRALREKLEAMANQSVSPNEAAIAREKLAKMNGKSGSKTSAKSPPPYSPYEHMPSPPPYTYADDAPLGRKTSYNYEAFSEEYLFDWAKRAARMQEEADRGGYGRRTSNRPEWVKCRVVKVGPSGVWFRGKYVDHYMGITPGVAHIASRLRLDDEVWVQVDHDDYPLCVAIWRSGET